MKQVEQEVFVPKDEGVARDVLPTKIQRRMFNGTIPGVVDVLTGVVEQCFHHKRSNMSRMDEDTIGVNRVSSSMRPKPGNAREFTAGCHVHGSCPNSERAGRTCSKLTITSTSLTVGT